MAYTKKTWVSGETPLSAENMNNIENGIANAHEDISKLNTKITETNTSANKRVLNNSYGTNSLGLKWSDGRLVGVVDNTDMKIVTDLNLNSIFKAKSIVKKFSNGAISIPFSELDISSRPSVMLVQPQSIQGIMMYNYDNSTSSIYITFHAKQSDGTFTAFTGDLRFCYMIVTL